MQVSSVNDVKIYNLSYGKSLPEVRSTLPASDVLHVIPVKLLLTFTIAG